MLHLQDLLLGLLQGQHQGRWHPGLLLGLLPGQGPGLLQGRRHRLHSSCHYQARLQARLQGCLHLHRGQGPLQGLGLLLVLQLPPQVCQPPQRAAPPASGALDTFYAGRPRCPPCTCRTGSLPCPPWMHLWWRRPCAGLPPGAPCHLQGQQELPRRGLLQGQGQGQELLQSPASHRCCQLLERCPASHRCGCCQQRRRKG